jgi:hydrogenase/urease accessory protein HupE
MAELTYVLCAATSILCAVLLARGYIRTRTRLLMWSTLCFVGLAINNILLFIDLVILPDVDLQVVRSGSALVSMLLLVIGLIWEVA